MKPFESGPPDSPRLNVFISEYLFVLRSGKGGSNFTVALPFLEESRFVPGESVGNVIHGVTGARFHEICNEFNRGYAPAKAFVFVEAGQAYLTLDGHIPFVNVQQVARGLKYYFDFLYSCSTILFGKAGLTASGFGTILARQPPR